MRSVRAKMKTLLLISLNITIQKFVCKQRLFSQNTNRESRSMHFCISLKIIVTKFKKRTRCNLSVWYGCTANFLITGMRTLEQTTYGRGGGRNSNRPLLLGGGGPQTLITRFGPYFWSNYMNHRSVMSNHEIFMTTGLRKKVWALPP